MEDGIREKYKGMCVCENAAVVVGYVGSLCVIRKIYYVSYKYSLTVRGKLEKSER